MATTPTNTQSKVISGKLLGSAAIIFFLGVLFGAGVYLLTLTPSYVEAYQISHDVSRTINAGDTAWVLTASALIMLMTLGVGFFYGGLVQSNNVISTITQSLVIIALVSIQWVLIGYTLVFGPDFWAGVIGGLNYVGLLGVGYAPNMHYAPTIPQLTFMSFHAMFAIITPALIIGAFVERIRFRTFVVFVLLWSTLIYDPIAHWVWNTDGWLSKLGALDFAGGAVVHTSSGFSALAAAIVIGKRVGFAKGKSLEVNNVPLSLLGAGLLWFGWFGFNAGSVLASNAIAASAFVATNISAAVAALVWMSLSWVLTGKPKALATATGAVAGLVVITPASGFVSPLFSFAIGLIGGLVTYLFFFFRNKRWNVDDTLDIWAVHGVGGVTGMLLTGVFASLMINSVHGHNGLLFGNPGQLLSQFIAVIATATYSFVGTYLLLNGISFMGLRVNRRDELAGLDLAVHEEESSRY